jgi:hypothetical protein
MSLTCTCGRGFAATIDHRNHLRDSPKHTPNSSSPSQNEKKAFRCDCGRSFASHGARSDHIRDSSTHANRAAVAPSKPSTTPTKLAGQALEFKCVCSRVFASSAARKQHLRDAPQHAKRATATPTTPKLDASSQQAQHIQDAPIHNKQDLPHVTRLLQAAQELSAASTDNQISEKHAKFAAAELNRPETPATQPSTSPSSSVVFSETSDTPDDTSDTSEEIGESGQNEKSKEIEYSNDKEESEGREMIGARKERAVDKGKSNKECGNKEQYTGISASLLVTLCASISVGWLLAGWKRQYARWGTGMC